MRITATLMSVMFTDVCVCVFLLPVMSLLGVPPLTAAVIWTVRKVLGE